MAKNTKVELKITQRQAATLGCALAECERLNLVYKKDLPMVQRLHEQIRDGLNAALNA